MNATPMISVLIADDEATVLNMYKTMLEASQDLNFHVMLATNGAQAIEMMATHPFGVIITDFNMPLANGHEVVKKALELHPDALIILNSGGMPDGLQDTLDWITQQKLPVVYAAKPLRDPNIGRFVTKLLTEKAAKETA